MNSHARIILVLQDKLFAEQLSQLLSFSGQIDIDHYRELSRGVFVEERIDLVVLELKENNFSNISSMVTMLDSLETSPPIVLLSDDKSAKRAKDFSELGVVAVFPSGFPAELVALQISSLLQLRKQVEDLQSQVKNARNVAMLSMSASSQLGEVVRFQEKSYSVSDFQQLADMLMGSVSLLGASCSGVFLYGKERYYFGNQEKRDVILQRLEENRSKSRFVDVDDGTLIYFKNIWVYLTNMPMPDSEEYGQLKDSIFPLIESAGQRAYTIITEKAAAIAERNKSWFLKNVSHSFREPMSSIISGTKLMRRRLNAGDAEQRDHDILHWVEISANQLADLIEDLLALSDAENIRVAKEVFTVSDQLADTLELYQRWAENKGVGFELLIEPKDLEIYTDPRHFKQILRSLLSNALKYTETGKISLAMEKVGSGPGELLEISLSDSGKGFDVVDVQPYLRPFVELEKDIIKQGDGAGLGLSVVVQLINQLDGSLSIESTPGEGSCFTVSLPVFKPAGVEHLLF